LESKGKSAGKGGVNPFRDVLEGNLDQTTMPRYREKEE